MAVCDINEKLGTAADFLKNRENCKNHSKYHSEFEMPSIRRFVANPHLLIHLGLIWAPSLYTCVFPGASRGEISQVPLGGSERR
jgi:hypothetical protein